MLVDFLQKPDADQTQENAIERLEKLIFQTSMVANISDESFGSASGIALRYKLQSMSNLAKYKSLKFQAGLRERYRIIFEAPNYFGNKESWKDLKFIFAQNTPANLLEETKIAQNLSGIVSQRTQLSALSIVPDIATEMELMEEEGRPIDPYEHEHEE